MDDIDTAGTAQWGVPDSIDVVSSHDNSTTFTLSLNVVKHFMH